MVIVFLSDNGPADAVVVDHSEITSDMSELIDAYCKRHNHIGWNSFVLEVVGPWSPSSFEDWVMS